MADYTPTGIIHNTSVDFTRRVISEPVHIVQGDRTLPTLAVELLSDGQPYTVPDGAQVNIALNKKDGTFVLNKADSVDGNIATFTVTAQMAAVAGDFTPEVQIVNGAGQATTGKFPYIVDKAEIQEGMLESTSERTALISYVDKAANSETAAKTSETNAKTSETNAKTSENKAKTSETNAATSEMNAKDSASAAKSSEGNAKTSEANASDSAMLAKSWAVGGTNTRDGEDTDNSGYYAGLAKADATKASDSATAAKSSEDNAKTSETNAATSETHAKTSETNAAKSATEAQGYADSALTAATNAAGYAGEAEYRLMINPETGHMALAHYKKEA